MADIPNNPGGPARTAPPDVDLLNKGLKTMDELLRATVAGFTDLTDRLENMGDSMDHSAKGAKTVTGHLREQTSEFKKLAVFSSKLEEQMNGFYETQKKISQLKKGSTSFADMLTTLKKMQEQSEQFMRSGLLDGKKLDAARKQYQAIGAQITKLSSKPPQEIMSTRGLNKVKGELSGILQASEAIAKSVKKVNLKGWQQDLRNADRAMSTLVGTSARMDKFTRYGQMGADILEARRLRSAGLNEQFHTKRAGLTERFNLTHKSSPEDFTKAGDEWNGGRGRLTGTILRRSMQEEASGKSRLSTRLGMAMLERGEGSALKGAVSMAGGFAESGASMAMGMVGKAAPVLAILDLLKDVIDKRIKMNSEVNEQLGQGGIYGGLGSSPVASLRSINDNLNTNPVGAGFRFGIGYDKNLSIAKAIVDGGMNVANLVDDNSKEDSFGAKSSSFGKASSFGTFQRNAQVWGRVGGLTSDETTAHTIKLISQYRQSLQGTEDFFKTINKDVAVAGITTSKYIGLLDDVNSHYDRSNKLLDTTVDIMRLLSRTGRSTAEDIKDMMDVATNSGKQRSLEVQAYLNIKAQSQPGGWNPRIALTRRAFDSAAGSAKSAVEAAGGTWDPEEFNKAVKGGEQSFAEYALQLREDVQTQTKGDRDTTRRTAANGAIGMMESRYTPLAGLWRNNKRGPQGALDQTALDQFSGPDPINDRFDQITSLLAILNGAGIATSKLFTNRGETLGKLRQVKAFDAMGTTPEKFMASLPAYGAAAVQTHIDYLRQGARPGETADQQQQREQIAKETRTYLSQQEGVDSGGIKLDMKKPAIEAMKEYADDNHGRMFMAKKLLGMDGLLEESIMGTLAPAFKDQLKPLDDQDQAGKAAQLERDTTPLSKILENVFKDLFLTLSRPLEAIAAVFGYTPPGMISGSEKNALHMVVQDQLPTARKRLATEHDTAFRGKDKDKLQSTESDAGRIEAIVKQLDNGDNISTADSQWFQAKVAELSNAQQMGTTAQPVPPAPNDNPVDDAIGAMLHYAHGMIHKSTTPTVTAAPAKTATTADFFKAAGEKISPGTTYVTHNTNYNHHEHVKHQNHSPAQGPANKANQDASRGGE